jgi:beta-N-acetylhexosaminidase
MGGIVKRYGTQEAAVRALKAGADVLLMPPDPVAAINAVYKAVQSGEISRKRIDESVRRVLTAKSRLGLHHHRLVELSRVNEILQDPDDMARAEMIAARAVTMLKNQNNVVPLQDPCRLVLFRPIGEPHFDSRSGSCGSFARPGAECRD